MTTDRLSICVLCVGLLAFVSGCSDSQAEYETPTDSETRGSRHPALAEKVAAAPTRVNPHGVNPHGVNPHGGNPHAGIGGANPHAGGGVAGATATGAEVPADWKPGDAIGVPSDRPSLSFTPDAGWKRERPKNRMREAQFSLPHADNDKHDGEMWVSIAMGLDFQSNVNRWRGSFREYPEAKVDDLEVNGFKVKIVELAGTYNWKATFRSPAEPRENYGMIVAMVGTEFFFRFIGPQATIEKWRPSFETMLNGLAPAR